MPLLEDPARLSKSRLKSDLLAHNVPLPPANSRKEVYVELHSRHIERRNAAGFSSDEEDRGQDEAVSLLGFLGAHLLPKPASFASSPANLARAARSLPFTLLRSASAVLANED